MLETTMETLRRRPYLFAAGLTALLLIANLLAEPGFADHDNWPRQLATMAPLVLVALASTPSVLSGGGGLDLSIGPLAVLCNVLLAQSLLSHGVTSPVLGILIVIGVGTAVGAINGVLVGVFRYQPVIATLCATFVIIGINLKIGLPPENVPDNWTEDLIGNVGGIVPGAVLLVGAPLLAWWLLSRTVFITNLYSVGGNDVTAYSAGVSVPKVRVAAYSLGGAIAACGGIALTVLTQSSQAQSTSFYILIGLTALALGGTQLGGGRGGMTGSFFGGCALYLMQTLLSALDVPANWINVVFGALLLIGVLLGAKVATSKAAPTPQTSGASS